MQNRAPIPREDRAPLADFTPVPRKVARHDGWSPERQRAFIEALADTGSVPTACRMVNMAKSRAYALRREPGAEGFRRAWDAALDMGLQILKDEAFDRALNGQLVPMIVGGRLIGYQRKKNDQLLMFLIRHFGVDATGRRVTINYFSSKASVGASAGAGTGAGTGARTGAAGATAEAGAAALGDARETTAGGSVRVPLSDARRAPARRRGGTAPAPAPIPGGTAQAASGAEASHMTMRTVITGPAAGDIALRDDEAAAAIAAFDGVDLDEEARAAILAALEACAARTRALPPEDDPVSPFVGLDTVDGAFVGTLEGSVQHDECLPLPPGEVAWEMLDDHEGLAAIDAAAAAIAAAKASGDWDRPLPAALPAADDDRPRPLPAEMAGEVTIGGPTMFDRSRARDAARRTLTQGDLADAAEATRIWQAAGTEETWAAWLAERDAGAARGERRRPGGGGVAAEVPAARLSADGRLLSEAELLAKGDAMVPSMFS